MLQGIFHPVTPDIHQGAAALLASAGWRCSRARAAKPAATRRALRGALGGGRADEGRGSGRPCSTARATADETMDVRRLAAVWRGEVADEIWARRRWSASAAIALRNPGRGRQHGRRRGARPRAVANSGGNSGGNSVPTAGRTPPDRTPETAPCPACSSPPRTSPRQTHGQHRPVRRVRRARPGGAAFKKGPDYIDPCGSPAPAGRACYNLDPFVMGAGEIDTLFRRHAADSDSCAGGRQQGSTTACARRQAQQPPPSPRSSRCRWCW